MSTTAIAKKRGGAIIEAIIYKPLKIFKNI